MKLRHITLFACALAPVTNAIAQTTPAPAPIVIPAPADPGAIPLYGDKTPGKFSTENWSKLGDVVVVRNVTRPTLTPVLPDPKKATGAAVIIAPGGAFVALATETEGYQAARNFAARGIAAFVLKYRLVPTPADEMASRAFSLKRVAAALANPSAGVESLRNPESTEDGLAALKLVRANAAKWGIDPKRVGMIGFSAGAMMARSIALEADPRTRPAFIGYIYGPQAAVTVPAGAPPMFDAIALDDPLYPTKAGFPIVDAWHNAKVQVELHAYAKGGHGFGALGMKGTSTTLLLDEFVAWLSTEGFLTGATTR